MIPHVIIPSFFGGQPEQCALMPTEATRASHSSRDWLCQNIQDRIGLEFRVQSKRHIKKGNGSEHCRCSASVKSTVFGNLHSLSKPDHRTVLQPDFWKCRFPKVVSDVMTPRSQAPLTLP